MIVQVTETTERWSDIKLDDGTILRVKTTVMSAERIEGEFDEEGLPLYRVKSSPVITIMSCPVELKRKVN